MREIRRFEGFVDFWDGRTIAGWAVDRSRPGSPCDVEVFANGEFVLRVRADAARPDLREISPADQRKGFTAEIRTDGRPITHLEVRIAGTLEWLPPMSEEFGRRIGGSRIDLRSIAAASSRWVPTPPTPLIQHITGQTGDEATLRRMYAQTGFLQAADVYNTVLDLGADPHRPGYSIVDLGCGCGRIATYLAQWLSDARFLGLDIWRIGVDWATQHITSAYGTYRFHCPTEKKKGYESGEQYAVPVRDGDVDLVLSHSLFTHLAVGACDSYLRETGRLLKPGGLAFLTFFLRDDASVPTMEAMAKRAKLPMVKEAGAWFFGKDGYVDIFHDRERIVSVAKSAKLEPVLHRRGAWHGPVDSNTNPIAFQDVLVFTRT